MTKLEQDLLSLLDQMIDQGEYAAGTNCCAIDMELIRKARTLVNAARLEAFRRAQRKEP